MYVYLYTYMRIHIHTMYMRIYLRIHTSRQLPGTYIYTSYTFNYIYACLFTCTCLSVTGHARIAFAMNLQVCMDSSNHVCAYTQPNIISIHNEFSLPSDTVCRACAPSLLHTRPVYTTLEFEPWLFASCALPLCLPIPLPLFLLVSLPLPVSLYLIPLFSRSPCLSHTCIHRKLSHSTAPSLCLYSSLSHTHTISLSLPPPPPLSSYFLFHTLCPFLSDCGSSCTTRLICTVHSWQQPHSYAHLHSA